LKPWVLHFTFESAPVTLDAGRYKEIGGLEGWAFVQGDAVTISQGGHKSKSFVVP
jgi:hypothetical protein